jgi:hypothetical protein
MVGTQGTLQDQAGTDLLGEFTNFMNARCVQITRQGSQGIDRDSRGNH